MIPSRPRLPHPTGQTHDEVGTCELKRPLTDRYKVSIDHRALEVEVVADLIDFVAIVAIERGCEAKVGFNGTVDFGERVGLARGRRDAGLFQPGVSGERLSESNVSGDNHVCAVRI